MISSVKDAARTLDQRFEMIRVAAVYLAERRRFFGRSSIEDWLEAEAEIDRLFQMGTDKSLSEKQDRGLAQ